ncbi:MAG: hypothetical protein EA398_17455 [Deltaproteobacteria bacterium]|nr:MAG: hypothetical protein EA398_17455 [Deltaproteobacteria bacterium]
MGLLPGGRERLRVHRGASRCLRDLQRLDADSWSVLHGVRGHRRDRVRTRGPVLQRGGEHERVRRLRSAGWRARGQLWGVWRLAVHGHERDSLCRRHMPMRSEGIIMTIRILPSRRHVSRPVGWAALVVLCLLLSGCGEMEQGEAADEAASPAAPAEDGPYFGVAKSGVQGLLGSYHHLDDPFGTRTFGAEILRRIDPEIDFTWGTGSPHPSVPADDFAIRWEGFLTIPEGGQWTLRMRTDDGVRLWLDDEQLIDDWRNRGPTNSDVTRTLAAGQYPLRIEYYERGGGAVAQFFWTGPGVSSFEIVPRTVLSPDADSFESGGLQATWYRGIDFFDEALVREEEQIDGAPGSIPAEVSGGPFSVRWEGHLRSPSMQPVALRLTSDEAARVWVDGEVVADRWAERTPGSATGTVTIPAFTTAPLVVEAFDRGGDGEIALAWSVNGGPFVPVPDTFLIPEPPSFPENGLLGTYHNDDQLQRALFNRVDSRIDFNWGQGGPDRRVGVNLFSVRWEGELMPVATGPTTLHLTTDDGGRVFVNDSLIIDDWASDELTTSTGVVNLVEGEPARIRVEYRERWQNARAQLDWTPPGQPREIVPVEALRTPAIPIGNGMGLLGEFFDGDNFNEIVGSRTEPGIDLDFSEGAPFAGLTPGDWTGRWSGDLMPRFTEATEFCLVGDGGFRVRLNNSLLIDRWDGGEMDMLCGTEELTRGRRVPIVVERRDDGDAGPLRLIWRSAFQPWEKVPASQLTLPSDSLGGGEGLRGEYFNDAEFSVSRLVRIDRGVDFDWTEEFPDSNVGPPNLSVRWNGQIEALYSEPHTLTIAADGGVRLVLDGEVLINAPEHVGESVWTVEVPMQRGLRYEVVLEYSHRAGEPAISLNWESPGVGDSRPIPAAQLFPPFAQGNVDTTFCEAWTTAVLEEGELDGADLDDEGRIRLSGRQNVATVDVWVANSGDRSVTRINALDGEVVHHYPVENFPSRTALDFDGNVWVANRDSHTVTKILASGCEGDDCVAFTTESLPFHGSSAPRGLAIDGEGFPWVGAGSGGWLHQLNPDNGEVTASFRTGWYHYGFAIDRENRIWVARMGDNRLGCFDSRTGEVCGDIPVPTTSVGSCSNSNPRQYGIAIDDAGNIWTAGWDCPVLMRFNRAPFDELGLTTFDYFPLPGTPDRNRGVAVDGDGFIWTVSSSASRLYRFNPETDTFDINVTTCSTPVGVGVIDDGSIWVNCFGSNNARRHQGSRQPSPGQAMMTTATQRNPYSYSDYTGFQLRNFTAPRGTWRNTFDCADGFGDGIGGGDGVCSVDTIDWAATVPSGTGVRIRIRTSDDGVNWSEWSSQYQTAPAQFGDEVPDGRFIEVEAILTTEQDDRTPSVSEITFWTCPDLQPPGELAVDDRVIHSAMPINYGVSFAFTDTSRLETEFELIDQNGNIFCSVPSDSSFGRGQRYSGPAPFAACEETFFPPNFPLTRSARAVRRTSAGSLRSEPSAAITAYTLTNVPTDPDLRVVGVDYHSLTVQWRRPANQSTHEDGLTGVWLERSPDPDFDPTHPGFRRIAHPEDADRGYPPGGGIIGVLEDDDLERGTRYHYRIRFQNADGIPSPWYTIESETWGAPCCYLGRCIGVCADAETGPNGPDGLPGCERPDTYEPVELTCDGLDNDCNGIVDHVERPCYSGPPETRGVGECSDGLEMCINGAWLGDCAGETLPEPEQCDGLDNDCNGIIDDGIGVTWFRDADGDGYGDPDHTLVQCGQPVGYVDNDLDCNDDDPDIHPGAIELCDGQDNNCNGEIDEGYNVGALCLGGRDGCDGLAPIDLPVGACFGGCRVGTLVCADDAMSSVCSAQPLEGIDVHIDEITTGRHVDLAACVNGLDTNPCDGTIGVALTIRNTSTVPIPDDSRIFLHLEDAPNTPLLDVAVFEEPILPGASVSVQVCFGNEDEVLSSAGRNLIAEIVPAGGDRSCTHPDDTGRVDNVHLPVCGPEQCDGFDNNGNGEIDEFPEACGSVELRCIYLELSDEYVCVGLQTEGTGECPAEPCAAGYLCTEGHCIRECLHDDDCGDLTGCHFGLCVTPGSSVPRPEPGPAPSTVEPSSAPDTGSTAGADASPERGSLPEPMDAAGGSGCSAAPGDPPWSVALLAFLLVGLLLPRRRTRRVKV